MNFVKYILLEQQGAEILLKLSGITFIRHAQNHWKAK